MNKSQVSGTDELQENQSREILGSGAVGGSFQDEP